MPYYTTLTGRHSPDQDAYIKWSNSESLLRRGGSYGAGAGDCSLDRKGKDSGKVEELVTGSDGKTKN